MRTANRGLIGLALVGVLALAACGSDKNDSSSDTAASATTAAPATTAASTATTAASSDTAAGGTATTSAASKITSLDTNGDGKVIFGVATPGPRNDGAYYQALVEEVEKFSKDNGYEAPIIVDNIKAEEAATQLDSLARQNVDVITVGAGEIGDPLKDLTAKYDKIIWYCNCGAGYPPQPNLIQSSDDGSEINYAAGVATGPGHGRAP